MKGDLTTYFYTPYTGFFNTMIEKKAEGPRNDTASTQEYYNENCR